MDPVSIPRVRTDREKLFYGATIFIIIAAIIIFIVLVVNCVWLAKLKKKYESGGISDKEANSITRIDELLIANGVIAAICLIIIIIGIWSVAKG
jgi:amino acid transporter